MIGCLHIPDFAIALERQRDPALNGVPLCLVRYGKQRGKVIAVSPEARTAGIHVGLSLTRARAVCPNGHFLTVEDTYEAEVNRLLAVLWTFSNRVEVDAARFPGMAVCYLDLGRLNSLALHVIGIQLLEAIGREMHLSASVGLASGKFPAFLASQTAAPVTLVPSGEEAVFVAPFSVETLPLSKEAARRLHLFCLRTLGELAALPREAVVAQFGKSGRLLHALARGLDGRPVVPRQMPAIESAISQFDEPVENRLRLDVDLHQLADELANRLEARYHALHAVTLSLQFANGQLQTQSLHMLHPVASAAGIARVLQQLLERIPLTEGISGISVQLAHLVPDIPRQLDLFTHKPQTQPMIDLVEVLAARHGMDTLYRPALLHPNSLLPERRFTLQRVDAS